MFPASIQIVKPIYLGCDRLHAWDIVPAQDHEEPNGKVFECVINFNHSRYYQAEIELSCYKIAGTEDTLEFVYEDLEWLLQQGAIVIL